MKGARKVTAARPTVAIRWGEVLREAGALFERFEARGASTPAEIAQLIRSQVGKESDVLEMLGTAMLRKAEALRKLGR